MQQLRFTLLQCRNHDDAMLEHELLAFSQALDIAPEQIRGVNMLSGMPDVSDLAKGEIVLVGGAGDFSVLDDALFLHDFFAFLVDLAEAAIPTFASCFGFQGMCVAYGGEVIHDEANSEVGTFELYVTDEAKTDPVFGHLPASFPAQLGHKDRAVRIPHNAVPLAYSKRAPHQAFKIAGKPIYATQFHPELTMQQNRERFERYIRGYANVLSHNDAATIRESFRPSPESRTLLTRFVQEVATPLI